MILNNKKVLFLVLILLVSSMSLVLAQSDSCSIQTSCSTNSTNNTTLNQTLGNLSQTTNQSICVYFFYGNGCPHCANVEPIIEDLSKKYPTVQLKPYEIYFNASNQELFKDFSQRYDVKQQGIPAVFIGDKALIGESPIKNNLENDIKYFQTHEPICPEKYRKVEGNPNDISPNKNIELTIPAILTAAAIDSINPCAFAVLIFLLVYLIALGSKKKVLKVGLTYITAVFIVYFLSGLGLFVVIQGTGLTKIIYMVAAIIAIIAGAINVKDFFWYGKGITLAIPESKKPLIEKYIHKASIPAAIILGMLVSLFELPCTGGVYLAILGLMSTKMTLWQGIPYLLLYNLIFVLPLFIILFLVYKGASPEKLEKWRTGNRKYLRLIIGLGMILLGVAMLAGWI
ncbi:MAG: cytochrome c biogenesis protein CcdA [Candidatus Pacearchaeota archaeon]|jgi:cytochrome c biogenesis protein CcdA/glutaredoxin